MNNVQVPVRAAFGDGASLSLVGASPRAEALRTAISRLAATKAAVLITGETGTGKELVARLIHQQSNRAAGPFIAVNCAALPAGLFQADVFGPEKGGYAGPYRRSLGRVEAAQGGTLFLDGIGDLAKDMQATLLRFLQEGTFERLGSADPIRADVRIITATQADLGKRCREGAFREDLYYRLNALHLETPPLRERGEDIESLAGHFLQDFSSQYGVGPLKFDEAARQQLREYPWPGNIRELRNRIMQAVLMCEGDSLSIEHLGFNGRDSLAGNGNGGNGGSARSMASLREMRQVAEREAITHALRECQGQVPAAAAALGISRAQLYRLIGRLRVDHHPFDADHGKSSPQA